MAWQMSLQVHYKNKSKNKKHHWVADHKEEALAVFEAWQRWFSKPSRKHFQHLKITIDKE